MTTASRRNALHHLIAASNQDDAGLADGELLPRFLSKRSDAAFDSLVRRYAQMVWSVCCRQLPRQQDSEDAFQATFLVLVYKAASVAPRDAVGN